MLATSFSSSVALSLLINCVCCVAFCSIAFLADSFSTTCALIRDKEVIASSLIVLTPWLYVLHLFVLELLLIQHLLYLLPLVFFISCIRRVLNMINLFICFILYCLSSFRFHSSCWCYIFYFIYSISFRFIYLISSTIALNIIFCFNLSFFNFTIRFLNFFICSIIYSFEFLFSYQLL